MIGIGSVIWKMGKFMAGSSRAVCLTTEDKEDASRAMEKCVNGKIDPT
jgi:hypothetical protein